MGFLKLYLEEGEGVANFLGFLMGQDRVVVSCWFSFSFFNKQDCEMQIVNKVMCWVRSRRLISVCGINEWRSFKF